MKIKAAILVVYSLIIFISGWLLSMRCSKPDVPVITEGKTEYNTVDKNPEQMPYAEVLSALNHYYNDIPGLDIVHIWDNNYMLTASLYERKWQKMATIQSRCRDSPRNLILANMVISSRLTLGVSAQYYYFITQYIGFGGGLSYFPNDSIQASGGVALRI